MRYSRLYFVGVFAALFLVAAAPASSQIMGDLPTIVITPVGGQTFLTISGFSANRGLVNAAQNGHRQRTCASIQAWGTA